MMCQKGIFRRKKCRSCVQPYPNFPCKICKRGLFQESSSPKPPPSSHYNISSDLHFFPVTTFPTELLTMIDLHNLGRCWSVGQKNQDTFCPVQVSRMQKIPHQNYSTRRFFPGRLPTQKSYLQQEKMDAINRKDLCSPSSKKYKKNEIRQIKFFEQIKYFGQTKYLSKSNRYCSPPNLVINPWEGVPTPRRL